MCRPHCKTRLLPNKGTASEVAGIVSATIFRNTVKDNKIVTPKKKKKKKNMRFNQYDPVILILIMGYKDVYVFIQKYLKKKTQSLRTIFIKKLKKNVE